MKEFPSVTVEEEVNPVPLMVKVWALFDPVTGLGETPLIVGATAAAATVKVKEEE